MVRHKAQVVTAKPRTGDIQISEDTDFKSMLLPQPILEGLKKSGYIKPSPIQKKALPLVRCGLDLIVQAKAGTGKTCVFTVAVLELVKPSFPHLQAVILAPTREIALQITSVIKAIGQCMEGLKVGCFIGGYPLSEDVPRVKGCQVAVGAPGRMKHLLEKGLLNPRHVRLFILDEVDKLMEKDFVKDINAIFTQMPDSKQVLACSATYTDELIEFLSRYMNGGQYVSPQQTINPTVLLGVRQFVSVISRHVDRLATLKLKEKNLLYLLRSVSFNQCLVFSNLHSRAVSLCSLLRGQGWGVEWIAGRQEQKDRVAALTQLRDQRVRVLVTTDVTARGVDVENVNLVINLDVPMDHHTYLHRMGRAGRYGSHGIVITVVSDGQELTEFQKLMGKIGGTAQSVNRVPQTLKNIDLWTMSDDKFEKIGGIVEKEERSSNSEKAEDSSTSTAEKHSPESSDSEDYVKECKEENIVGLISGAGDSAGMVPVTFGESLSVTSIGSSELTGGNTAVTSNKADDSTSTDEKFSPDSSDGELSAEKCNGEKPVTSQYTCVCNLYEADAADVKVIAGPSLFALKKEKHWREVLPVIVNESKVPLNTPIALLDSKLIRVRFWNKTQKSDSDINIETHNKQIINFDPKCEDKDFLSFIEIVSFLENGSRAVNSFESVCKNNDSTILSFEQIEESLESGFCEMDGKILVTPNEIEEVLTKYKRIKEKSENALISFDSFDLVGWLAVDELHNIIEEINIDKCEVFEFNLVTCLAGKNHIEVVSPSKGMSKEAHDYIDHITTLNVESFPLSTPFSLASIAQQLAQVASNSSVKLLKNKISSQLKHEKNKLPKQTLKDSHSHVCDISSVRDQNAKCSDAKNMLSSKNNSKVPIVKSDNKKSTARKDVTHNSVNGQNKCSSINTVPSTSKQTNQTKLSYTGSTSCSNSKSKNESKGLSENKNKYHKEGISKFDKKVTDNSECVSLGRLQAALLGRQQHQCSSDKTDDSGPYVDMTWNLVKKVHSTDNTKLGSNASHSEQRSQLPPKKHTYIQESLIAKPEKSHDKNKYQNGFEHIRKHRNSDDSYDSFDTVEYETTDLDKRYHKSVNENETQRKHLVKHQDSTNEILKESNVSHESNPKLTKCKVLYSKQERSKPHESRNKPFNESQDTYSSIESECAKLPFKAPSKREQKSKTKYLHEGKHKAIPNDTEESYKESYDSYDSIDSEISKLRELNTKLYKQDKVRRRHNNELRHKKVQNESEDDLSIESGATNRHSFRTACSQHDVEDLDCFHGYGISNRISRLSHHTYESPFEIPPQTRRNQPRFIKYLDEEQVDHHSFEKQVKQEEKLPQQEYSQNVYSHNPYGICDNNQFGSFQNSHHQHQDSSNLSGRGSTQIIRGEHLHSEWYSNWYLRVRQRATQLAMMEYVNTMSTQ